MSRYLDPKADVVFKKIFADHPHLLISFLNAVLPLPADRPIVSLEYLPAEMIPKIPSFKKTIADVRCVDTAGRIFIVEMQIDWTEGFKQRLLFESGNAYVKQLDKGKEYSLLQPVYGLGLVVASTFDQDSPCWYHHYQLVNTSKTEREIIEHLQLIFIELPKFPVSSPDHKRLRLLWLRFLREINSKTVHVAEELLAVPEICEAVELTEEAAYSPAELRAYESYWDAVSIEKTFIYDSYRTGKAEGLAEGEVKGRLTAARLMKAQGLDTNTIVACTGISEIEIKNL